MTLRHNWRCIGSCDYDVVDMHLWSLALQLRMLSCKITWLKTVKAQQLLLSIIITLLRLILLNQRRLRTFNNIFDIVAPIIVIMNGGVIICCKIEKMIHQYEVAWHAASGCYLVLPWKQPFSSCDCPSCFAYLPTELLCPLTYENQHIQQHSLTRDQFNWKLII